MSNFSNLSVVEVVLTLKQPSVSAENIQNFKNVKSNRNFQVQIL